MAFMLNSLPALLALALDGYAGFLLLPPSTHDIPPLLAMHLLACITLSWWMVRQLPQSYVKLPKSGFVLFFCLSFFIPVLGAAGLIFSMSHALRKPNIHKDKTWEDKSIPDLPFQPIKTDRHPSFGQGGLANLICSSPDPERRLQAVIALRQVDDKVAVPLLQQALKDPADDVRLLAYSMLDSKEVALNEKITKFLKELESASEQDSAVIHYTLAQNYWALAYVGLATGNTLDYVLGKAAFHLQKVLTIGWPGSAVEFLLGKVYLRMGQLEQSLSYLQLSLKKGHLKAAIIPYMAEIAYEQRDFIAVRKLLNKLNEVCEGNTPIPTLVHAWTTH